jgi:hypothetical protein
MQIAIELKDKLVVVGHDRQAKFPNSTFYFCQVVAIYITTEREKGDYNITISNFCMQENEITFLF